MSAPPTSHQIQALIQALERGLLERDLAVRLSLLAVLAGEHVLLIGAPGTAKSDLARRLHRVFEGAPYFERLLTRFSTPEELFGPLSLKALEDDRYERLTEGFLPTAGIAFLDEVFKANSAILNALLTLLNERAFDNGQGRVAVPLISVVAASNEVPVDDALLAFHDRFLVRLPVEPVSDAAFADLLQLQPGALENLQPLTHAAREAITTAAQTIALSTGAIAGCQTLRTWMRTHHIGVSDRRWRRWMGLMRTAAATEGRHEVDAIDLWTAPYVVSPSPAHVAQVAHWFAAEVLQAVAQEAAWLTRAVEAFEKQLDIETSAPPESDTGEPGDTAGKLALARAIGQGEDSNEGAGMLRIVSQRLEQSLKRHYSSVHIAARVAQLDEVLAQVSSARTEVEAQRQHLEAQLSHRFWIPPSLAASWLGAHAQSEATLNTLYERLQRCRKGFASLPMDDRVAPAPPQAVALPTALA